MKTKIEKIWAELENDNCFTSGLLLKRYSSTVLPNIYVALHAPEKERCLAVHISRNNGFNIKQWENYKDIKIEVFPDEKNKSKSFVLIILLNWKYKDVFSVLSEDLIFNISNIASERQTLNDILNRLVSWQNLFDKQREDGLSEELQIGLYGELYFLRKLLTLSGNNYHFLQTWQVPSNKAQDFHYNNWAVEVKSTHSNNPQKIQINSARQLDNSIVPDLFLYHLSLDIRNVKGETLNQIVDTIEDYLSNDLVSLNNFKLKLFEIGYFDIHKAKYDEKAYNLRNESIFQVKDDFPRILENQTRNGVGDVRYSILISECTPYRIEEGELFNKLLTDQ